MQSNPHEKSTSLCSYFWQAVTHSVASRQAVTHSIKPWHVHVGQCLIRAQRVPWKGLRFLSNQQSINTAQQKLCVSVDLTRKNVAKPTFKPLSFSQTSNHKDCTISEARGFFHELLHWIQKAATCKACCNNFEGLAPRKLILFVAVGTHLPTRVSAIYIICVCHNFDYQGCVQFLIQPQNKHITFLIHLHTTVLMTCWESIGGASLSTRRPNTF